jgi:hypothetical protein
MNVQVAKHRLVQVAGKIPAIQPPLEISLALLHDFVVSWLHLKRPLSWVLVLHQKTLYPIKTVVSCIFSAARKKTRWFKV